MGSVSLSPCANLSQKKNTTQDCATFLPEEGDAWPSAQILDKQLTISAHACMPDLGAGIYFFVSHYLTTVHWQDMGMLTLVPVAILEI